MASNLVFLSGPHGGGKTTLARKIQEAYPFIILPELKTSTPKFHTGVQERQALKLCQKAIENYEVLQMAKAEPDKLILGNRCIYDGYAYSSAFRDLGWVNENEHQQLVGFSRFAFPEEIREPYAIVLNPPFEVVWDRLQNRWQSEEKKWREEDKAYAQAACNAYKPLQGHPKVLYLEDNTKTKPVLDWLETE
ncbi:MAG: AAA family ATPase [Nanoarchaeota archaeon]